MKVKFLYDRPPYSRGQVVDHPHPGVADVLVRRGICEAVLPEPEPETEPEPKQVQQNRYHRKRG